MKFIKNILPLLIVVGLSYWAIKPLFIHGFFPIHDDTQVARVFEMGQSLGDGMFPVRWVSDLGYSYGYPIFNFYGPLAYYLGGFFILLGLNALFATKAMMILGILLAGVGMYFLSRQFWGEVGAILSALLYMYAPYHAVEVYVRGDVSEFFAYALIPFVFYALWQIFKKRTWKYVALGSLSYAGIVLSHNLSAMMITPFILAFSLFLYFSSHTTGKRYFVFLPIFVGVLLSAFYWLPVFPEMKYTNVLSVVGGGSDYRDHFVCPMQLWNSPWGFGGSSAGCLRDGLSFKLGKLHIMLFLLSLVSLFFFRKSMKEKFAVTLFFIVSFAFSIFLTFDASKFIWQVIPQMAFLQFPWRFIVLAVFFMSFVSGAVLWAFQTKKLPKFLYLGIGVVLISLTIFINVETFNPLTIINKSSDDYTNQDSLTWFTSKISDEYMPVGFSKPKNKNEVPGGRISLQDSSAKILSLQSKTQKIAAVVEAQRGTMAVLNIAYFPAWHVYVDQKEVNYKKSNKGLILEIPAGRHTLVAAFVQTPIEKAADFLTIVGVIVLGIIYFYERKKA